MIAIYEAYTYDGGKPVTYEDIVISYNNWGSIVTWSSYSPDLSAYAPACAETEPQYAAKFATLIADVYSAENRATFTTCTGVAITAPNFGKQITDYQADAAADVTTAETAKSDSLALIASLTVTINEKIAEELRLRNLAIAQRAEYAIKVTAAHLHAETCPPKLNPIDGYNIEIARLEQVIVDETLVLATKWESYWTDLKANATAIRDPLVAAYDSAVADIDNLASYWPEVVMTGAPTPNPDPSIPPVAARTDPTTTVKDSDMRWKIASSDIPTLISICDNASMQLFWGTTGDAATDKAGPAHGALTNCEDHELTSRITSVKLNKLTGDNDYLYVGV